MVNGISRAGHVRPSRQLGSTPGVASSSDYHTVLVRSARGAFWIGGAHGVLVLAGVFGAIWLARLLSPADFGIYAISSFVVLRVNALAELGLNTNIIHSPSRPSTIELRSLFTLHALMAFMTFLLLYVLSPWLTEAFQLPEASSTLFRCLSAIILMQPFRSIPIALLTRESRYGRVAIAEVLDGVTYQGAAVTLAHLGLSYWSFGLAALLSSLVGTLALMSLHSWPLGMAWRTSYLKRCVRFGGAFQLASLTAIARDNIVALLGGPLFGPSAVGLLNWSLRLAWLSTQTYAGITSRISFPALSRTRSESARFAMIVTMILRYVNFATLLTLSIVSALLPEIIRLVFTAKWTPAIPLFYCFAVRMIAGSYTTLLDAALKAHGLVGRSVVILSLWTAWEWALSIAFALLLGPAGIALAAAIGIWFAALWLYIEVRRIAPIRIWRATATPVVCGGATFVILQLMKTGYSDWVLILVGVPFGILVFFGVAVLMEGFRFLMELKGDIGFLWRGERHTASERDPGEAC